MAGSGTLHEINKKRSGICNIAHSVALYPPPAMDVVCAFGVGV
jgi:hypothetical protein